MGSGHALQATDNVKKYGKTPVHSYSPMANAIRALSMDAVEKANSGHPGMPMGMADAATVLFAEFLKFDPKHPEWADRDRFILSAGHGSMLLYSLLYLTGYKDITLDEIKQFRQLGARTAGHPEFGYAGGIETTTGPLGQGISNAVGFALAERIEAAKYGNDVVDHYTYVIAGDGCLMEGISHEAISLAGHLKLNKLIVLWDDNEISIDGATSLSVSDDQAKRFEASGWNVIKVDGHNVEQIRSALTNAKKSDKPTMIACRTVIAHGAPTKAGTSGSHGSPLGKDEIAGTRENLEWKHDPFDVPAETLSAWRKVGEKGAAKFAEWEKRLGKLDATKRAEFERVQKGDLPKGIAEAIEQLKQKLSAEKPKHATRQSSGNTLEVLVPLMPELIGGSADLTGSVNTKVKASKAISAKDYNGNYVYYGVREHGMCAAMNGMALHGGIIPYAGTFFVFTDYCRPSIRLAALMKQRVVFVMTHDSIGLGEDGPTHQPVEHLAACRVIPNLNVIRPADGVETAEAWQIALESKETPTMLVLTRQGLPTLRTDHTKENLTAKGGYIISPAKGKAAVTIIGTGSEVSIAVEAQTKLRDKGVEAQVVSMPSMNLFDQQPAAYKKSVLGDGLKVAVEAAVQFGWEKYIGADGIFVGMTGFGESAPAPDLYKHFGITSDAIVEKVLKAR
ncbi:MAG: transketolase [Proteobacteria bacterium]|nr:transketolase [Pseudomonadota bacterium]